MFYPLFAEAHQAGAKPWYDGTALGYMIDGGIFMWPILIMAIIGAAVIIERYRSLRMLATENLALRRQVLDLLHADKVEEAMELCNRSRGPVAAILAVGLRRFLLLRRLNYDAARIEEQVVKSMDDYGVHIIAALERNLPILGTISALAPMVGSVGTVVGMVILFKDIASEAGAVSIVQKAAAGIQIKLLVTVWGLLVGIPAYVFFNYFTNLINRYVLHVEETASELIEAVTLRMALREQHNKTAGGNSNGAVEPRSVTDVIAK